MCFKYKELGAKGIDAAGFETLTGNGESDTETRRWAMIGHVVLSFSTGADRQYNQQCRVLSVQAGEQAPILECIISIEGSSQSC